MRGVWSMVLCPGVSPPQRRRRNFGLVLIGPELRPLCVTQTGAWLIFPFTMECRW